MGLNVGGIHVATTDRDRVVALIKEYWSRIGAAPLTRDPLAISPLSLQKTGELGFVVSPAESMEPDGTVWVAVYDSERYTADPALARHLADSLSTYVVFYEMAGATNSAYVKVYGRGGPSIGRSWDAIESFVGAELPYGLTYYNKLKEAEPDALDGFEIFGFERVPYRESAKYRGPSEDEKRAIATSKDANALAKAHDRVALRALYDADEGVRFTILMRVCEEDPQNPAARAAMREFAREILEAGSYLRVRPLAIAAFLDGDRDEFERCAAALGEHATSLDRFALTLLEAKSFDDAVAVLRVICACDNVGPSAWNNLAFALFHAPTIPDDISELLATADANGAANPSIFHNTACAWLQIGERDKALAAVEAAARTGYEKLATMKTDADLAALFDEPRFKAAFEPGRAQAMDLDELIVTVKHKGESYTMARPVMRLDLFLADVGCKVAGPALANVLEAYLGEVPAGEIATVRSNGPWKKLNKGRVTRDLNTLRKATNATFANIHYRGETDGFGGQATPYGIELEMWGRDPEGGKVRHVPTVMLWFPAEPGGGDVEAAIERVLRYASLVPYEAGAFGFVQLTRTSDYAEVWWDSDRIEEGADRFLGTARRHPFRDWHAGHSCTPSWLTLLDAKLVKKLGGKAKLAASVGTATLSPAPNDGVCIRASLRPAWGVPPTPTDLGALPAVSRALEPIRLGLDVDWHGHYARIDALPDTPWVNGPPNERAARPTRDEAPAPQAATKKKPPP